MPPRVLHSVHVEYWKVEHIHLDLIGPQPYQVYEILYRLITDLHHGPKSSKHDT